VLSSILQVGVEDLPVTIINVMLLIDGCNGVEAGGQGRAERIIFQVTTAATIFLASKKWTEYRVLPAQMRAYTNLEGVVIPRRENEARAQLVKVKLMGNESI